MEKIGARREMETLQTNPSKGLSEDLQAKRKSESCADSVRAFKKRKKIRSQRRNKSAIWREGLRDILKRD